ncbi:GNAT family N-acetyltransferase [Niallia oryzisoli]|uniref:GNAT family N-acetyltransferase n=1 Tax=Niallia oryzisoli TaxID=1737571 RepID=A0ABZ2CFY1_9BACI
MTIKWEEITKDSRIHLEEVLKLYDEAFPIDIREPHHIFDKALESFGQNPPNTFRFLVGLKNGRPVSFTTGHYLAKANCGFIVYLGTDHHERSKGLGSQALRVIEEYLNRDAVLAGNDSIKAFVLETEKLEAAETEAEREACLKRDHFYKMNGYQIYKDIDYVQPPLNGGNEIIPLKLLIKKRQQSEITAAEVQKLIYAMYVQKYLLVNNISIKELNGCLKAMSIPAAIKTDSTIGKC